MLPNVSGPLALVACAAIAVSVSLHSADGTKGCNKVPAITTDVGQVTVCVEDAIIAAINAGTTTFEDIAVGVGVACGPITAQEIQNIIQLWTNGNTGDAGTVARPALAKALADATFTAKLKALHHKS